MKRGLVVLDPAEVSAEERAQRLERLRTRCRADEVSIALIYGDVYRSDDISYFTNLCIYWNEGILAVPAVDEPAFLTKLSPRVHPWMRRTSVVTDLRSGRSFQALVAGLVEGRPPGVLGLVDGALWPKTVVDEIAAAAPGWDVRLLGGLAREQRLVPSAAELALLRDAAAALDEALDSAVAASGIGTGDRIAVLERDLRGAGFTDLLAQAGDGPDGVASLEVSGQYRNLWVHGARLLEPAGAAGRGWHATIEQALRAATSAVAAGAAASAPARAAAETLAGLPAGASARVTCVNQADLSTHGDFARPDELLSPGGVVAVAVEVLFAYGGRLTAAETVLVGPEGAEPLAGQKKRIA